MKKFNLGNKLASLLFIAFSFACVQGIQAQQKCGTDLLHNQLYENDQEYRDTYDDYIEQLDLIGGLKEGKTELQKNGGDVKFIPVAVHFEYNPADATEEACLIALAQNQVNFLNEAYGANSCQGTAQNCFEFCLATKGHPAGTGLADGDPSVTFNGLFTCPLTGGGSIQPCANPTWNGYINISVHTMSTASGTLGIAFRPSNPNGNNTTSVISCAFASDGAGCVLTDFAGSPGCASLGSTGATVVHEVGHMLGLRHVFCCGGFQNNGGSIPAGGCCENAAVCGGGCMTVACDCDELADTPPQADNMSGCPGGSPSGTVPNPSVPGTNEPFNNFMDYVNDECMNCFSEDQYALMHDTYDIFNGYQDKGAVCSSLACDISNIEIGEPECTPFGDAFTVTVTWFGVDPDSRINGGVNASPASVQMDGNSATFTYPIGVVGPITFEGDCFDLGSFDLVSPTCVEPVPTMGEWGIAILGLILVIFGIVAVRQYSLRTKGATN